MIQIPGFDEKSGLISNILAIGGFVILIVIVVWGFINLARLSGSWFSSLFGSKVEKIALTAPAETTSGEAFSLSWNYTTDKSGSYVFIYPCEDGLRFETPGVGGALTTLPCGSAFPIGPTTGTLSLLPLLSGTASVNIPVSVIFMPNATGTPQAQGSTAVTVNARGATSEPTSTPVSPTLSTPAPSTGPADLSVRITGVSTDAVVTSVTFDIANAGGSSSGTWYFTAQLPTAQPYTYSSSAQTPLAPGAHIVNTLRFTGTASGGGTFVVSVDPSNAVAESNESNNGASQWVNASYQAYNYSAPAVPAYNYYSAPSQYQYYDPQFIYSNSYRYSYPQYSYPSQQYPYTYQYPYQYLGSYQYPYSYQY